MIIPISISTSGGYKSLRDCIITDNECSYFAHFSNRPGQLFEGAQNRLTIWLSSAANGHNQHYATKYMRWDAKNGERGALFNILQYCSARMIDGVVCKVGSTTPTMIMNKVSNRTKLSMSLSSIGNHAVYWIRVPGYFCQFFRKQLMAYPISGEPRPRGEMLSVRFDSEVLANAALAILNSSLFYLYFSALTDTRHINPSDVRMFPIGLMQMNQELLKKFTKEAKKLIANYRDHMGYVNKSGLKIESINSLESKPIIDEIDELLAKHYGFTEEELDFIINYDIKYRMGDKLNEGE